MTNDEISKLDFSGWPIPNDYVVEIGRVALLWAVLENLLVTCIGKLAGFDEFLDERAYILLVHSTFPQRLDNLASLCDLLKSEFPQLQNCGDVISLLKSAQKARNRFVHHAMSLNPETKRVEMGVGSARGQIKTSVEAVSIEDIKSASVKIDEANRALYKLIFRREIPPSWEHIPRQP